MCVSLKFNNNAHVEKKVKSIQSVTVWKLLLISAFSNETQRGQFSHRMVEDLAFIRRVYIQEFRSVSTVQQKAESQLWLDCRRLSVLFVLVSWPPVLTASRCYRLDCPDAGATSRRALCAT